MTRRMLPVLHPAGIALGALLTGVGVFLAEWVLGPLLARSLVTPEERMIGLVHRAMLEDYAVPPDKSELMHRAVEGMLTSRNDPYTFFIGPEQTDDLEEESSGNLIGIGIRIGAGGTVIFPRVGSPAEKGGLRPGDRILAVDGESIESLTDEPLADKIKGQIGTVVHLALERPNGDRYETDIVRSPIPTRTVRHARMLDAAAGIGALHITAFARSTPSELDAALEQLGEHDLRGLILDMRYNPGGVLDAAKEVAARFLDGGLISVLRDRSGTRRVLSADPADGYAADLPVVVLINEGSASGSEVVAGALRDRGAAVLVGSTSFGKGVFQQVRQYPKGNFALKFSAGYYLTPSGRVLEGHLNNKRAGGLVPDVPVEHPLELRRDFAAWMSHEPPPEKYRAQVHELFPSFAEYEAPEDPVLETGLRLLQDALKQI